MALWLHETSRVYRDMLSSLEQCATYDRVVKEVVRKFFPQHGALLEAPLNVFCHFAHPESRPSEFTTEMCGLFGQPRETAPYTRMKILCASPRELGGTSM